MDATDIPGVVMSQLTMVVNAEGQGADTGAASASSGNPFLVILIIAIVAVAAFFVWRRYRMAKDPEYAATVAKRKAARDLQRQKERLERAKLKEKKAKFEEATASERRELIRVKREYNGRVKRREDELKKAQREHDRAVRDQEKAIEEIEKRYSQHLASTEGIKLYADRVSFNRDTVITLNSTFHATLMTGEEALSYSGQAYNGFDFQPVHEYNEPSKPGTLIGGLGTPASPWPVDVDPQGSYLIINGVAREMDSNYVNACMPLDERAMRGAADFVAAFNDAASGAEDAARRRVREIEDANAQLESLKSDTSAIDDAKAALDKERENKADIDAAQKALDESEAKASEELDYKARR